MDRSYCNPVVPGRLERLLNSIAVCHFQTGKVDTVPGSRQNDKQYLWNTVEPVYGSRRCLHAPDPDFVLLLSEVLHGRPWLFKQFRRKSLNVFEDCGSAKHVAIWYQRGQNTF